MKTTFILPPFGCVSLLAALLLQPVSSRGAITIVQTSGSTAVAWEAENYGTFINNPPETWTATNEVAAAGGAAIIAVGDNITASPTSSQNPSPAGSAPARPSMMHSQALMPSLWLG